MRRIVLLIATSAMLSLGLVSCVRTTYSPGFSDTRFRGITKGDACAKVISELGLPLFVTEFALDKGELGQQRHWNGPDVSDRQKEWIGNENGRVIVLSYSAQRHSHLGFHRRDVWLENAVVTKLAIETVSE
jgi:hypothetical protein